jgi:type I restriction-modification system DNA methylase subunit
MSAPESVIKLCETFAEHREHFRSGNYNEFQLRKQFLDPLFEALGWDMANSQGLAPQYRDVIHEDAIKIGAHVKAPDYAFTLHGQRKFFLEAKKPSVNIKTDIAPAYQLRRYAWSAKLPLSILSDFEEFAIYDTRIKPAPGDPSSKARVFYCTYDQYPEKWDEIAAIFARDSILKGSFDKYADSAKKKKGTAEVDTAFLEEIERWRDLLARNFALRNPSLNVRDLNFAVQKTIDRLVFLRICEDRGTEDYGRLRSIANGTQTYPRLLELFRAADARYNSGLFHFSKEKSQAEEPDTLTPNLSLDDKTLKDIIAHLYYPDSPYEFSVLPADILGSVYERFLGKTIRLTEGHQAKIEEKPEVRKAGGVYYTPSYIVDYIVENTLGKLLTPEPEKPISLPETAKLKVVDPACGSGSFLIVAYQYLLDWHRDRYAENVDKWSKGKNATLYQAKGGEWRLTTAEKKRILLNNIHGVDIDAAAVEVTKLSLLLKVLEGETGEIAQRDFLKERERILPDLANNIKCGNSLIGSDFYSQPDLPDMDADEHLRVNVFDWNGKDGFPEIMKAGGFDAVIGNPPYLRIQGLQENYGNQINYFTTYYDSASKRFDFYMLFIEKGYQLLGNKGRLGYICPHKFTVGDFAFELRSFLIKEKAIERLLSFGQNLVFASASTYTGILILNRERKDDFLYAEVSEMTPMDLANSLANFGSEHYTTYKQSLLNGNPWQLTGGQSRGLLEKLGKMPENIGTVFSEVMVGVQSGIDEVHLLRETNPAKEGFITLWSERENSEMSVELEISKPIAFGEDVHRYMPVIPDHRCIYPYELDGTKTRVLEEIDLKANFPSAYAYLRRHKDLLYDVRVRQKTNPKYWYSCHRAKDMTVFERLRIITPEISKGCNFTLAQQGLYHNTKVYSLVPNTEREENLLYWLGILNTRIMWWFLTQTGTVFRGGFFCFKTNYLRPFPLPVIDPTNKSDVATHDRIVALVEKMLNLHEQRTQSKTPHEQTALDRQISATDRQIDRLVYDLYGLTEEEIALVESV